MQPEMLIRSALKQKTLIWSYHIPTPLSQKVSQLDKTSKVGVLYLCLFSSWFLGRKTSSRMVGDSRKQIISL
jgi:hypothetical protein